MALKARRECEAKVHEQVYSNIYLLTFAYPTSENLEKILSKDMFVKNNKTAFQQVTYFLLTVLNPEVVKQKLPSWPPLEPRIETQFRNEVMKYVNELNTIYEDANIPVLMTSHLISPGGFKFAKFMLKLSQLVVLVHLRRDPSIKQDVLYPIRPNKNAEVTVNCIKRVKCKKNKINEETNDSKLGYEKFKCDSQSKALAIMQEKLYLGKVLIGTKKQDLPNGNLMNLFDVPIQSIESKLKQSERVLQKGLKIRELISRLFRQDVVLNYNELSLQKCDENLNLLKFFENLNVALNTMYLKKPSFSTRFLKSKLETHLAYNQNLQLINKKCDDIVEGFTNVTCLLENNFTKIDASSKTVIDKFNDNEILAVPLENSSDSSNS